MIDPLPFKTWMNFGTTSYRAESGEAGIYEAAFATAAELDAFRHGVEVANGYLDYVECDSMGEALAALREDQGEAEIEDIGAATTKRGLINALESCEVLDNAEVLFAIPDSDGLGIEAPAHVEGLILAAYQVQVEDDHGTGENFIRVYLRNAGAA